MFRLREEATHVRMAIMKSKSQTLRSLGGGAEKERAVFSGSSFQYPEDMSATKYQDLSSFIIVFT